MFKNFNQHQENDHVTNKHVTNIQLLVSRVAQFLFVGLSIRRDKQELFQQYFL